MNFPSRRQGIVWERDKDAVEKSEGMTSVTEASAFSSIKPETSARCSEAETASRNRGSRKRRNARVPGVELERVPDEAKQEYNSSCYMEAVKMTTQVIPISKLDSLEKLSATLEKLVARGDSIEVRDPLTDLQAKEFEVECKSYEKAVDLFTDPEITELRERVTHAVSAKKALMAPMLRVFELVRTKRRAWEESERVAAEKANAKQPKKGGEAVQVSPSIPTLAGAQSRRMYKVSVEDEDAVLYEWLKAERGSKKLPRKADRDKTAYRAMFLRSYIKVDAAAVQAAARSKEGWEKLKSENVPGLKFWTE
jgi:hypothetical protein